MELHGPLLCEATQKLEYALDHVNEEIILQVEDPDHSGIAVDIQDTNDETKKRIEIFPDKVGKHLITVFNQSKGYTLLRKEFFCFDLDKERWHVNELHGSLEDVHILMEVRLHHDIIDQISAQAHLISQVSEKRGNPNPIQCCINTVSKINCDFSFKPPQFGSYEIRLFCGHKSINRPRPSIHVVDYSKFKLVHSFTTNKCVTSIKQKVSFIFDLYGAPSSYLRAYITCPDKTRKDMLLYGEEKAEKIGQLRSDFIPSSIGTHSLVACYGNVSFDKCPLAFEVYDTDGLTVVETIPSLSEDFFVDNTLVVAYDCSRCGHGLLDVSPIVYLNSGATLSLPVDKRGPNKQGLVRCSVKLAAAGKYIIKAFYNNELVEAVSLDLVVVDPFVDQTETKMQSGICDVPDSAIEVTKSPQKEPVSEEVNVSFVNIIDKSPHETVIKSKLANNVVSPQGITVSGQGLLHAEVGKVATFSVDPKEESGQLLIDVQGPKSLAKCLIRPESGSHCYCVEYNPTEIGQYIITILWNNKPIKDSPFNVTITDGSMVRCLNYPDIFDKTLVISRGKRIQIDFECSKAGDGKISAITGETMLRCWRNDSKKMWSFFVESNQGGLSSVSVLWNEEHIGTIMVQCQDINDSELDINDCGLQVVLRGRGIKEALVGVPSEFIIDTRNAGEGKLNAELNAVKGAKTLIPVEIEQTKSEEYRCTYTARVPGDHLLNISWGKKTIKGSPFTVHISDNELSHETGCKGDGQHHGFVGEDTYIDIETGVVVKNDDLLSVTCTGPNGRPILCHLETKSGSQCKIRLVAPAQGRYQLNVLYGNNHIIGSPFYPTFADRPSSSNIIVTGPGLMSTSLAVMDSRFTVDARKAGTGRLTVQVKGPQESFHVEVERSADNDRLIQCSYNPIMPGEYTITVCWNGILTRCSPFNILLT